MSIAVVINQDSRAGIDTSEGGQMGSGARSWDFFGPLLRMHAKFWEGMDVKFISYIDGHKPLPLAIIGAMQEGAPGAPLKVQIVPHRIEEKNDSRYLAALRLADADFVAHFDQDVFCAGDASKWIAPVLSGQYKFVSYPCASSPDPDPDRARWQNFRWASTRAFFCRREDLRLDDLEHCLRDMDWAYATFGEPPARMPWTEHFLGLMAGPNQVYYPPLNDDYAIWSWSKYIAGTLGVLNQTSMDQIQGYIERCGGISWSGELEARPL